MHRENCLFELTSETGVRMIVKDDGVGIAKEYWAKVFDPFFTMHLGHGTSGLGLYIAHNTVTQILNGTIHILSHSGDGCEFAIDFPLIAPE